MTELYEYQSKIVDNPAEMNVFVGARQTGKTTACIHAVREWAPDFDRLVYLTPMERAGREVMNHYEWPDYENVEIRGAHTVDEDYFRGISSQCVIVDEPEFIDWKQLGEWQQYVDRVFMAGTPFGLEQGVFYDEFCEPGANVVHASAYCCPHVDWDFVDDWKEDTSEDVFLQEIAGMFPPQVD